MDYDYYGLWLTVSELMGEQFNKQWERNAVMKTVNKYNNYENWNKKIQDNILLSKWMKDIFFIERSWSCKQTPKYKKNFFKC